MTNDAQDLHAEALARIELLIAHHTQDQTPRLSALAERLERIDREQRWHVMRNEEQHAAITDVVGDVCEVLNGKENNGKLGAMERIRNLEDLAASVKSWGKWLKGGVGLLLLKSLWDVLVQVSDK